MYRKQPDTCIAVQLYFGATTDTTKNMMRFPGISNKPIVSNKNEGICVPQNKSNNEMIAATIHTEIAIMILNFCLMIIIRSTWPDH